MVSQAVAENQLILLEDVVVEWMLRYAALSNVDLAHLSNVSKRWRAASKRAIKQQIVNSNQNDSGSALLLLPSMVRYIQMSSASSKITTEDTFCAAWFHPDGIQELSLSLNTNDLTMFSANSDNDINDQNSQVTSRSITPAFAPHGEPVYDNSDKDDDDTKGDGTRSSRSSRKQLIRQEQIRSRSPAENLSLSNQQQRSQIHNGATTVSSTGTMLSDEPKIPTCSEWRGYRTAIDVLRHFGYTASFVDDVIASAQSSWTDRRDNAIDEGFPGASTNHKTARRVSSPAKTKIGRYRDTTYAVRGAIISRPESYCDCIDKAIEEQLRTLRFANAASMTSGSNNSNIHNEQLLNNIRIQEYKESILRKEIRRKELQRDVLPRIITRVPIVPPKPKKNCSIQSFDQQKKENDAMSTSSIPEEVEEQQSNKRHRCVQFLNANGGHAVCMLTPPFACGPLLEPVTILCVGIATEDGCFLSGLNHRFELGHLYPNNIIAEISEQSPVCIATDCSGVLNYNAIHGVAAASSGHQVINNNVLVDVPNENSSMISCPVIQTCDDDDDDRDGDVDEDDENDSNFIRQHEMVKQDDDDSCDDSDDGDCDNLNGIRSGKCECIFNGAGEKIAALDEGTPRIIHRGRLGPGTWHCYVAIFDGENSSIRIDGIPEVIQTENPDDESNNVGKKAKAMLDGLTIGSDHCFGMSLCCGNGSGGEGEGAIAELAVFQGRLDLSDIKALEKSCMERHCIPSVPLQSADRFEYNETTLHDCVSSSSSSLWKENDYARQAHALFFLPETDDGLKTLPSTSLSNIPPRIPLRFLSRHRSVAWKYCNPVTGEPIHIKRIGCKPGASSSDL